MRHRPLPLNALLPAAPQIPWFQRDPKLPHRRPHRRHFPREPRRNRHELRQRSRHDCVKAIQDIRDVAVEINPEILVLCHGGPIAMPEDARYVLSKTKGVQGFFGASSVERLPVEKAITETMEAFKRLSPSK